MAMDAVRYKNNKRMILNLPNIVAVSVTGPKPRIPLSSPLGERGS
jgi:hypothetical protein